MAKIFISHRRKDKGYAALGIKGALSRKFGKPNVYFDLDSILVGLDWRQQIDEMVAQCDVMIVVIGDDWLELNESGRSRLEDDDDLVHFEVLTALKRDIPVIPVLVGNAKIPAKETLPETLIPLHYRQAVEVRDDANFNAQIEKLLAGIEQVAPQAVAYQNRLKPKNWVRVILPIGVVVIIVGLAWQPLKKLQERLDEAVKAGASPFINFILMDAQTTKEVGLFVRNNGTGTAFLRPYRAYIAPNLKFELTSNDEWRRFLSKLDINESWVRFWRTPGISGLSSGEQILIFSVEQGKYTESRREQFNRALDRVSFVVCYCSSLDECSTEVYGDAPVDRFACE